MPAVPDDNPLTAAKVELGRHLFYDNRLSSNSTLSCASCHRQELAFTDGRARGVGATRAVHPRNSMSLTNVAYNASYTWADPGVTTLEAQALVPMFNESPIELGIAGNETEILERLRADAAYRRMFREAFPEAPEPIDIESVARALASFERTLLSGNSAFDRFSRGEEPDALDAEQVLGMQLFYSDRLSCFRCHAGFNFSGPVRFHDFEPARLTFHDTGLAKPPDAEESGHRNTGLAEYTGRKRDRWRFRTPTLRNIELTAPYMHDGRFQTLDEVIEHYASGGETQGPGGRRQSRLVRRQRLTRTQKAALVAFLESLTDQEFVTDSRFANPWLSTRPAAPAPGAIRRAVAATR